MKQTTLSTTYKENRFWALGKSCVRSEEKGEEQVTLQHIHGK